MSISDDQKRYRDLLILARAILQRIIETPSGELLPLHTEIERQLTGFELKYEYKNIATYLFKPEEKIAVILQAHLLIERCIEQILFDKLPNYPVIMAKREFSYSIKLDIAYASGLISEEIWNDLSTLNTIRNRFAHRLDYSIEETDISSFMMFKELKTKLPNEDNQFCVCRHIMLLRAILFFLLLELFCKYPYLEGEGII